MISIGRDRDKVEAASVYRAVFAWLHEACAESPRNVREQLGTEVIIRLTGQLLTQKRLALKIETAAEAKEVSGMLTVYLKAELARAGITTAIISETIDSPRLPAAFRLSVRYDNRTAVYEWQRDRVTYKSGESKAEWFDDETHEKDVAHLVVTHLRPSRK